MDAMWGETEEKVAVNIVEVDALVAEMRKLKDIYAEAKEVASEHYKNFAEVEGKVIAALEAAGKKSWKLEGVGTFSLVNKSVVTVPKSLEAKRALFAWIEVEHGRDALDAMRSINHMSLNSFYNEEIDKHKDDPMFTIAGLEAPTIKQSTRFRKA